MGAAILSEAALSFLGARRAAADSQLGTMLSYGKAHLLDAPHLTIFPGIAIAVLPTFAVALPPPCNGGGTSPA